MISSHRSQSTFQVAFISASPLPRQRAISFPYPQVYSPCKRWYLVSANEKPDSRVNPKKVFVSNNGKAPRRPTQLSNAPQPSYSNVLPSDRGVFPPGKLPLSLEIDFLLSHPWTDVSITFLVVLNCFAFALQTIDVGPVLHEVFRSYENNVTIAFLIEYFCRWYGKGLSPRFLLTRRMIIDFLAVSPIAFAVTDQSEVLFVRMLRLTRIFRLERMVMDTKSSQDKMKGMTFVQVQLASIGLSLFSLLYVSAGLFYQVEKGVNPAILNFFDAFYFSTITLFTVGFGDVTPLTSWGRISKKSSICHMQSGRS